MGKNQIFEVDVKGLRQLQSGKPMWFIVRELLQNAMDENITLCTIYLKYENGKAHITVEDDSPIGFRDLADSYTLFKDTYKRVDVKKRGRFNFGEKQVLCLADYARIISTTGGIEFEILKGTRKTLSKKREKGSEVYVVVKMTRAEFNECLSYCTDILVAENIKVIVSANDQEVEIPYKAPHKVFTTKLQTEIKEDDRMRLVTRETEVHIHKDLPVNYIYEMGIPICEIDCQYSIDVQQKVPMSNDRDKVDSKYLKTIYGEVLNQTVEEITSEQSSDLWVRNGFTSERANKESRQEIITKRFGEKALIANTLDMRSMDEAISNNYNVVYGSEMHKDEWAVIRQDGLLESTSSKFKTDFAAGTKVEPDSQQIKMAAFSIKCAKEFLDLDVTVSFYDSPEATVVADFNQGSSHLRFNVAHISKSQWEADEHGEPKERMIDLIIHELGHSQGLHYEQSYHDCITLLGSKMAKKALRDPKWFKL